MSRLSKRIESEQSDSAESDPQPAEQPAPHPEIQPVPQPNPVPQPAPWQVSKNLVVAIFAGITVAMGIYTEVIDLKLLHTVFGITVLN